MNHQNASTSRRRLMSCAAAAAWFATSCVSADDWPHWRGQNRDGHVRAASGWTGGAWPGKEVWRIQVEEGSSSPLVVGGCMYTFGWQDGKNRIACRNAKTGDIIWQQQYATSKYGRLSTGDQGLYSGPSSTPEFDVETGYLYTLGNDGDLHCWNTQAEGKMVWTVNLYDRFDVPQRPKVGRSGLRDYGYTSSPLIQGRWVLIEVGARQGNLVAFDRRTGEIVWASQSTSSAGHNAGPAPITVQNVPCVAVLNHDGLLVVRLDEGHEGQTVATWPWVTSFANNIASVAVSGDSVLVTSEYNQNRIERLRITLQGAVSVWKQTAASKVCTPVIHDGHVYWAWRNVVCLDWQTGELKWRGGRAGDPGSCIVTSDSRLIVWTGDGDLTLVETAGRSPGRYMELAAVRGIGRSDAWPHVVFADGRLYCKDRTGQIVCYQVST